MTTTTDTLRPQLDRLQKNVLIIGLSLLVISIGIAFAMDLKSQFFQSYLLAFFFWTGIALGCWGLFMLHHLIGGRWGFVIQRLLESGMSTIPLLALLFLPIAALGMHDLYEWTHAEVVANDEILQHKSSYLNLSFFYIRAVLYFAIWGGMSWLLIKWSTAQDETGDPVLTDRIRALSGPGIPIFGLTVTFASFDWLMSLDPHWFSTIYGVLMIISACGTTVAFVIIMMAYLRNHNSLAGLAVRDRFYDWGKLELAFVLLWFYIMLSQFLIIWAANLPEETPWYLVRTQGEWAWVSVFLVLFRFVVPFFLLLSVPRKQNPRRLVRVAVFLMLMHFVDLFWHIAPNFHANDFHIHIMDILLPIGIGGVWLAFCIRWLKSRPLVPQKDPRFQELIEQA